MLDDDPVFSHQRNYVRHGGDGHQLQERLQHASQLFGRPIERSEQRVHKFEGDARPAQVLVGILAVAAIGIEHRQRGRKLGVRQVMIGDDDVDAAFTRRFHDGRGPDAGVDADDELDSHGRRALDHVGAHAVTIPEAMRNVKAGLAAGHLDGFFQNDD